MDAHFVQNRCRLNCASPCIETLRSLDKDQDRAVKCSGWRGECRRGIGPRGIECNMEPRWESEVEFCRVVQVGRADREQWRGMELEPRDGCSCCGLSMDGEKNQGVIIVRVCTIHSL